MSSMVSPLSSRTYTCADDSLSTWNLRAPPSPPRSLAESSPRQHWTGVGWREPCVHRRHGPYISAASSARHRCTAQPHALAFITADTPRGGEERRPSGGQECVVHLPMRVFATSTAAMRVLGRGPHQMSSGKPYLMRSSFSTLSRPMKICVCRSFDERAVKYNTIAPVRGGCRHLHNLLRSVCRVRGSRSRRPAWRTC